MGIISIAPSSVFLSYCAILSSAKNGKLDDAIISLEAQKTYELQINTGK
jgi:hypothetical protein